MCNRTRGTAQNERADKKHVFSYFWGWRTFICISQKRSGFLFCRAAHAKKTTNQCGQKRRRQTRAETKRRKIILVQNQDTESRWVSHKLLPIAGRRPTATMAQNRVFRFFTGARQIQCTHSGFLKTFRIFVFSLRAVILDSQEPQFRTLPRLAPVARFWTTKPLRSQNGAPLIFMFLDAKYVSQRATILRGFQCFERR